MLGLGGQLATAKFSSGSFQACIIDWMLFVYDGVKAYNVSILLLILTI